MAKPNRTPKPVGPVTAALEKRRLNPKLTEADIEAVAQLIAKRKMTQAEACATLNINLSTFQGWLTKHAFGERFSGLVTRARAASLDRMLGSVEHAATVGDERGRTDWRAAQWLASRVLVDDGRYDEKRVDNATGPAIDVAGLLQAAAKVYCSPPAQAPALPAPGVVDAEIVSKNETV
jgi:hypothetical protein